MASFKEHRCENVASARDLIAKIVEVAQAARKTSRKRHKLVLLGSKLSGERATAVFEETITLFPAALAERLSLEVENTSRPRSGSDGDLLRLPVWPATGNGLLRRLVDAKISGHATVPGRDLSHAMGLSEHPIRLSSRMLEAAGLVQTNHDGRSLLIEPWECTPEMLARVNARPIRVSYRYRAGATPLSSDALARRFGAVWRDGFPFPWLLSGVPAARLVGAPIDLSGAPRIDLVIRVPVKLRRLDLSWLAEIAPRMEREPNPLELSPLILTIVQEESPLDSEDTHRRVASHADILLALLDQGLVKQARKFVADVRRAHQSESGPRKS